MNELISVIVPAYNVAPYLPNCLDSLLAQTYSNMQIIVVDDGSTDHTWNIAEEYAERFPDKVKCLHQENGGVSRARFVGISAAEGDWIGFTDGDDEVEPEMYQRLLDNAKKFQADISHCGYQIIANNGERVHYFYNTGRIVEQDHVTALNDLLEGAFIEPSLCNKLFRKELIVRLVNEDQMDLAIRYNEDLLMNFLLFQFARNAVFEDICSYHYLARNSSASRTNFNLDRVLDPIKVRQYIVDQSEPETLDIAWRRYLTTCGNGYYTLFKRRPEYKSEAQALKSELLADKAHWETLTGKERTKLKMMLYTPRLYHCVYSIYAKFFQKKVYE